MKVKNLIVLYCLGLAVLACTHNDFVATKNNELYAHYQYYTSLVEPRNRYYQNQTDKILAQITPSTLQRLINYQQTSTSFLNEIIESYLSFPASIKTEFNHYEFINKNHGCLLINGYDNNNNALSMTISYRKMQTWQIEDIYIEDLAPFNRFLSRAICDRKKLAAIRHQEML